ncbi:beta propeller repeat protein [Mucilaginibacter lappiensis]|uniref:BNR repeat-like domain-containing protein n=1 Tax=Mucilaginibacter lappiensis TaxID=354630 RepID=A0A841JDC4_9SPHI|nr:hypothetical protein [Mucilaginibacter lappiensis]MBB6128897.1 hypothetical protein [Mucilaginibacter lappiensis]
MKKLLLIIITIPFIITSCKKDNKSSIVTTPEDPNWIKLEIPNGEAAYAVAGNIDGSLLVTTKAKAYFTTDQGKTWQESKNFNGPIQGLYANKDTVLALLATGGLELEGTLKASIAQFYTLDMGKSWNRYLDYQRAQKISKPIGIVQSAQNKVTYELKYNTKPVSANSNAYTHGPTTILRDGKSIGLPFKVRIENLYMDSNDRLYVAASGGVYNQEKDAFTFNASNTPAVIYVSRKALP